jgi:hypothetical protein
MTKLSLLLALLGLVGCRSPQEATQTIVMIHARGAMGDAIKSVRLQTYALRDDGSVVLAKDEARIAAPVWPVKRTVVPQSATASHHFRLSFTGYDDADNELTNLQIETDIVEGASRYLLVRLDDNCRVEKCDGGVCRAEVAAKGLGATQEEAIKLEWSCVAGGLVPPEMPSSSDGQTNVTGVAGSVATDTPNTQPGGMNGNMPSTMTGAANGGALASAGDAGVVTPPNQTDGKCAPLPCGEHGICTQNDALVKGYECSCEPGWERDATADVCHRNACTDKKGGCEDECTPDELGEAVCACTGPTRWLKGDLKQCAEVREAELLDIGRGSLVRTRPQVAFDSAGNGIVVWTEKSDSGLHTLWSARYRADTKAWELPSRPFLSYATTDAADLHLGVDANGTGLLVWTSTVESKRALWSSRYSNEAFSPFPNRVDLASEGDVLMPALAVDANGDALVTWTDTVYPKSSLRASRFRASAGDFSPMETRLVGEQSFVFGTAVALNGADSGLIAWTEVPVSTYDGGSSLDLQASSAYSRRVGSLSSGDELSSASALLSTSPDIVMDAQGNGVAVWIESSSTDANVLRVMSKSYVPSVGWSSSGRHTLSESGRMWSTPRVARGADGSVFAVWRESPDADAASSSMQGATLFTRGALRIGETFGDPHELGLPSAAAFWGDINTEAWSAESTVTFLDQLQPSWSIAVGPQQVGFVAGASFDNSTTPARRQLWLQRVSDALPASEPILFTDHDSVPGRPSTLKLGLNANGDGAIVWDRQTDDGHYHVYANVLD